MIRRFGTALFLLLLLSIPLIAADLPDGKWWKRPRLAEEVGLTADQQQQIEKIFVHSRPKLIDLKADLEKKQLALQVAMEDRGVERREVEKKIEAVETARAELQKARALMILDMKQVLKPEQWERLLRRRDELMERRQEIRERMRDGLAEPPERSTPRSRPQPPKKGS